MAAKIIFDPHIFGIPKEELPLLRNINGRIRYRFRPNDFAKCYIKTEEGIKAFVIKDRENHWVLSHQIGENHKPKQTK